MAIRPAVPFEVMAQLLGEFNAAKQPGWAGPWVSSTGEVSWRFACPAGWSPKR